MKHKQPKLARIISQSLSNKSLSHAYLLVGDAFLLESAKWLSAVILSQSMEVEETLSRLNEDLITDFILIDGSKGIIKKEEIMNLQNRFKSTALEQYNQKVVIIHQVHTANVQALNSILKFLEEPSGVTTTFILTTDSLQLVLPTITSRCMIIQLESEKNQDWELAEGQHPVIERHLKAVCNNSEEAEALLNEKEYQLAASVTVDLIDTLIENVDLALVHWQLSLGSEQNVLKYTIEIMIEHCRFLMYNNFEQQSFTYQQIKGLYETFILLKSKLNPSTNLPLLVDEGCYHIREVFYGK